MEGRAEVRNFLTEKCEKCTTRESPVPTMAIKLEHDVKEHRCLCRTRCYPLYTCGIALAIILAERSCITTTSFTFPASNAQIRRSIYTTYESSARRVSSRRAPAIGSASRTTAHAPPRTRAMSSKKRYRSRSPPTTGNSFPRRQTDRRTKRSGCC